MMPLLAQLKPVAAAVSNCAGNGCDVNLPNVTASSSQLSEIIQIILAVIGAVAVLILVLAGLRFITAQGNPQEAAKARSAIIFAAVGIIVVAAAEAIVGFVLGHL